MITILAAFGLIHFLSFLMGAFILGVTYAVRLGLTRDIKEWHKLQSGDDE